METHLPHLYELSSQKQPETSQMWDQHLGHHQSQHLAYNVPRDLSQKQTR